MMCNLGKFVEKNVRSFCIADQLCFKNQIIFDCIAWFVLDLVRQPEDRFSIDIAQMSDTNADCLKRFQWFYLSIWGWLFKS